MDKHILKSTHKPEAAPPTTCPTCGGRGYVILMDDDPEDGAECVPCWNCGDVYTRPLALEQVAAGEVIAQ